MPRYSAVLGLAFALLATAVIHAQTPPGEGKPSGEPSMEKPAAEHPAMQRSAGGNPVEALEKSIAGREKEPAGTVFKNVQILKTVPAGQLIEIMKSGFSRSLGVRCSYCHVMGEWAKDDKSDKQVARDMLKMTATINNDLLKNIKNLMSDKPEVTCATCHRGKEMPATSMDGASESHEEAKPSGR